MVILVRREELEELLKSNIDAWMEIGGGPNMDAFEFDPNLVNRSILESKGYFSNRDAWIAGVQLKKLLKYVDENLKDPTQSAQNYK